MSTRVLDRLGTVMARRRDYKPQATYPRAGLGFQSPLLPMHESVMLLDTGGIHPLATQHAILPKTADKLARAYCMFPSPPNGLSKSWYLHQRREHTLYICRGSVRGPKQPLRDISYLDLCLGWCAHVAGRPSLV